MKKLANEWLVFAHKDLMTIEKILDEGELTNISAFHSHQCIEKAFKAVIVYYTDTIPKIHNLLKLFGTVKNHITLKVDMRTLEEVNETYIDTRYPSDLGLQPYGFISISKVKDFYNESRCIYEQIKLKLS